MKTLGWWMLRGAMAALFAYAGIMKALDPAQFAVELHNYRLLPSALVPALAYYVPWLELVCAAGLIHAATRPGAWLLIAALSLTFAVFVTSAWIREIDMACGCFGGEGRTLDAVTVGRTAVILLAAGMGMLGDRTEPAPGLASDEVRD